MKVIVKKYLNARALSAKTDSPIAFVKNPGDILDVDDILKGTMIEGNALWYHSSADNCFYWTGGCENTNDVFEKADFPKETLLAAYHAAVNELSQNYTERKEFRGLGAGFKKSDNKLTDSLALVFYVAEKSTEAKKPLPSEIKFRGISLQTDIQELKGASLLDQTIPPDFQTEYPMGGSVSEILPGGQQKTFGTRSLLVTKPDLYGEKTFLLTCYHVACASRFATNENTLGSADISVSIPSKYLSPGAPVFQSGKVICGEFGADHEFALIEVDETQLINTIPGRSFIGHYQLSELQDSFLDGLIVFKYGATTLETSAQVLSYHSESLLIDEARSIYMSGLIVTDWLCTSGDSGAPVVDAGNKLVGIIVAGKKVRTGVDDFTFILPIDQLIKSFSITPKAPAL